LIEIFGDQAIYSILEIIKSIMVSKETDHKKVEVAMLLLGIFVEDIQIFTGKH
jgi:hypothetical protein